MNRLRKQKRKKRCAWLLEIEKRTQELHTINSDKGERDKYCNNCEVISDCPRNDRNPRSNENATNQQIRQIRTSEGVDLNKFDDEDA